MVATPSQWPSVGVNRDGVTLLHCKEMPLVTIDDTTTTSSARRWLPFAALALVTTSCAKQPMLPAHLTVAGGPSLVRAKDFSTGGLSGVVFIPVGEKIESASLQLGILMSKDHQSPAAFQDWILAQYRASPTQQWYETVANPTEACKIGLSPELPPRPFVAVHKCQGGAGVSACAEADERLSDEIVGRCLRSSTCWDEICNARFAAWRGNLQSILDDMLRER